MTLFESVLKRELTNLKLEEVKINFLGDLDPLPIPLKDLIKESVESTLIIKVFILMFVLTMAGRRELVRAAQKLAERSVKGELDPSLIDENLFASELFTASEVDPDLLIRTSGEKRISNFLLWQLAYAEIHVTDVLWPDFNADTLTKALLDYQSRRRRFGGV